MCYVSPPDAGALPDLLAALCLMSRKREVFIGS